MNQIQKILVCLTLMYGFSAHAWREVGHFSICEIAYQSLTPTAKLKVDAILGGKSFSEQCTWPDMVRKSTEWKHTYDWHFVNVEDNQDYLTPEAINHKGDVMFAILKAKSDLLDSSLTISQKKSALLFLGHFIGDIHQVVHIGRKSDLGGNRFFASWFEEDHFNDVEHLRAEESTDCLGPFYRDEPTGECVSVNSKKSHINLHKIWDLLMVDQFIHEHNIESKNAYPYKEYVKIINKVSKKDISAWQNSYVLDWAQESLCYRPWVYDFKGKNLGEDYYQKHIKTLNSKMLMGGYRLGVTLNRIFDPTVAMNFAHLDTKENNFSNVLENLKQGKSSSLQLSLKQCSIGVVQAP